MSHSQSQPTVAGLTQQIQQATQQIQQLTTQRATLLAAPAPTSQVQASQVVVNIEKNVAPPELRTAIVAITQHVVAQQGYNHAELVGAPTGTTGTGASRRRDPPHLTVRLDNRTIHIYIRHSNGAVFQTKPALRNASYNYGNLVPNPQRPVPWDQGGPTEQTPLARQRAAAATAKAQQVASIDQQIQTLRTNMATLNTQLQAAQQAAQQQPAANTGGLSIRGAASRGGAAGGLSIRGAASRGAAGGLSIRGAASRGAAAGGLSIRGAASRGNNTRGNNNRGGNP